MFKKSIFTPKSNPHEDGKYFGWHWVLMTLLTLVYLVDRRIIKIKYFGEKEWLVRRDRNKFSEVIKHKITQVEPHKDGWIGIHM